MAADPQTLLSAEAIQAHLKALPVWAHDGDALVRKVTFPAFLQAISFVNALAHLAERQDHHPDIRIAYHTVTLRYWTHTAQGVTMKDIDGAREAEALITLFEKPLPEEKIGETIS